MTVRRAVAAVVVIACACALAALLLVRGRDETATPSLHVAAPPGKAPRLTQEPTLRPHGPFGAQLARRTQLRASPGGRVLVSLGMRTGYGSARVLSVVARRGRWLAVLSDHVANSRTGWIPAGNATLLHEPYSLLVDLSDRELVVHHEGRPVRRIRVAVGRAATATPTGRFAVTDRLRVTGAGGAYGCCALALTARQPNVPQGWSGGDRIAIHGTSNVASLGTPASGGCLRAADRDIRWLLARVPLGAPVRIRA